MILKMVLKNGYWRLFVDNLLLLVIYFVYLGFLFSLVMVFICLVLGLLFVDCVVVFDLIFFIIIGFIVVYSLDSG